MTVHVFNWDTWSLYSAALCVWREARGEGYDGMLAVANVIMNRQRTVWRGKGLAEVVSDPHQFSSMTIGGDSQTIVWPSPNDQAFGVAFDVMNAAANGTDADPTQGATFYRNAASATSEWFQKAIATGKLMKTVTIGRHDFYREA